MQNWKKRMVEQVKKFREGEISQVELDKDVQKAKVRLNFVQINRKEAKNGGMGTN